MSDLCRICSEPLENMNHHECAMQAVDIDAAEMDRLRASLAAALAERDRYKKAIEWFFSYTRRFRYGYWEVSEANMHELQEVIAPSPVKP
jgi:hypothetical protein